MASPDDLLDLVPDSLERDVERLQGFSGITGAPVGQAEQDVLRADVVVVQEPRLILGEHEGASRFVGESLEQRITSDQMLGPEASVVIVPSDAALEPLRRDRWGRVTLSWRAGVKGATRSVSQATRRTTDSVCSAGGGA